MTFCDLLRQNEIFIPMKGWMPRGIYNFISDVYQIVWEKPFEVYKCWIEEGHRLHQQWKSANESLYKDFSAQMPAFEIPQIRKFKNPKQAYEAISEAREALREMNIAKIEINLRNELIKCWLRDVLADMPDDCKLIVIKNMNYNPTTENSERFEQCAEKNESNMIASMFGFVEWIALKPDAVSRLLAKKDYWWNIRPNSAIVEYRI